jgi:hypothetical protein
MPVYHLAGVLDLVEDAVRTAPRPDRPGLKGPGTAH